MKFSTLNYNDDRNKHAKFHADRFRLRVNGKINLPILGDLFNGKFSLNKWNFVFCNALNEIFVAQKVNLFFHFANGNLFLQRKNPFNKAKLKYK